MAGWGKPWRVGKRTYIYYYSSSWKWKYELTTRRYGEPNSPRIISRSVAWE